MSDMSRGQFLLFVSQYIAADPETAAYVSDHVARGLSASLEAAMQRASDMEIIAATLAHKKYKGSEELIKSKLRKLNGKTSMNWDWFLKDKP